MFYSTETIHLETD